MIPLPMKFDENEWFIMISILILYIMVFLMPHPFPSTITILIFLSGGLLGIVADIILGVPPYDLYDANDSPKFDLFDMILWTILYPPFGYILLYAYEKYKFTGFKTACYILICSILSLGVEWTAVQTHVFHYKGWTIWYSFPVYLTVISLFLLFYRFLKWRFLLAKRKLTS